MMPKEVKGGHCLTVIMKARRNPVGLMALSAPRPIMDDRKPHQTVLLQITIFYSLEITADAANKDSISNQVYIQKREEEKS